MSPSARWALEHGGDDSLPALLTDVLGELGFQPSLAGALDADLVLVHLEGPAGLTQLERAARRAQGRGGRVVLALLPFADEVMNRAALQRGAHGVFALGTPLDELRRLVGASLERSCLRGAQGREKLRGG